MPTSTTITYAEPLKTTSALYFPALTGIRAIAAYIVFIHHESADAGTWWALFKDQLFIGVTIFFVLSGFLITVRYYERFEISASWFAGYIRKRVARIYPLYFLLTCLTFLLMQQWPQVYADRPWISGINWDKPFIIFTNLTFLRGFFDDLKVTGIAQGWTLTVEESFYAAAPILFLLIRWRRWSLWIAPVVLALVAVMLFELSRPIHQFFGFFRNLGFIFYVTFLGRSFEFICGIALALYVKRNTPSVRSKPFATVFGLLWIAGSIAALMATEFYYYGTAKTISLLLVNNVVLPIGVALFFFGLLAEQTLLRKVLETPLMDKLGKSSYAFYLIHLGVLNTAISRFVTENMGVRFLLLVCVAWLLYQFVEKPAHRLLTPQH
ncbi:acyltransferase [Hymenobacter sp. YC55]|uniref:acyltransferase family protein n=1 Tax=Hymenobacter sp. YC55 TaxID=3034019 RepID=UPI0023F682CC|nr:acyltransferase [Hymenobacter sp. YC55]MDF7810762.1 acyltransferase [Hymenobacter sp. YC55]